MLTVQLYSATGNRMCVDGGNDREWLLPCLRLHCEDKSYQEERGSHNLTSFEPCRMVATPVAPRLINRYKTQ